MLSTQYRLKLEAICNKIASGETVELSEMIWVEKLSKSNRSAATILRQARRKAANPDMDQDGLDGFMNALDIGNPDPSTHKSKFNDVDEIVDFFKRDDSEDWRTRD